MFVCFFSVVVVSGVFRKKVSKRHSDDAWVWGKRKGCLCERCLLGEGGRERKIENNSGLRREKKNTQ